MMGNNKSHFLILILQLNCWTLSKKLDDYPPHKLSQASLLTHVLYERTEGLREGYRPSGQMCLCTGNCQANIKIGSKSVFQPHKSLQPVSAMSLICNLFGRKKLTPLQQNLQLRHWSNVKVTFILLLPACQSVYISLLSVCHPKHCHCPMILVTFLQPAKGNIYLMCSVISFLIKYTSRIRTSYRRHSTLLPLE